MKYFAALTLIWLAQPAAADTLVAARTIRSHSLLTLADIVVQPTTVPGALNTPDDIVGLEARVVLYAGRPIRPGDVGPAAVVERNQVIPLIYNQNGLTIMTEGRALGRAGPGDRLRVMNLSSRTTVSGRAAADGAVYVGQ